MLGQMSHKTLVYTLVNFLTFAVKTEKNSHKPL